MTKIGQTKPNHEKPSTPPEEQVQLVKATLGKDWTDEELRLFLYQCQRTGLDPLTRQIYGVKRWSRGKPKITVQVSIDGFRLVAERTGNYGGQTTPEWCDSDGIWRDVWIPSKPPVAARVGVWRLNFKEPTYGVAKFDSYAVRNADGKPNEFWSRMPEVMISKVAEALALRKAFPQELSGLYTSEEMDQANDQAIMDRQEHREEEAQRAEAHLEAAPPPGIIPAEQDIDQANLELATMKGRRK